MENTSVGIPRELRVILDDHISKNPRFKNRSQLVHHIVWDWVKEKNNLKIEGDTASVGESA